MSQSPRTDSSASEVRSYDIAWAALNKLIRSGRSFSGGERHCCYLNLGPGRRFANVSAVTGLDLPEDGRGLALTDWDHDGRVDLWITNRTGPRVRFFRNELVTANRFVSFLLEGSTSNRDAVGARVTVQLADDPAPLTRTVHAGSGYRSQSSKWLHFGLGSGANAIAMLTVRWPGGLVEQFPGTAANSHYLLREGSGQPVRWDPPQVDDTLFTEVPATPRPPADASTRVVLLKPAPLPSSLRYTDATGTDQPLSDHFGKPFLLNLWATWCPNCEDEMAAWTEAAPRMQSAPLPVLSLCVDDPGDDHAAALAKARDVASERGYPFAVGMANPALLEILNTLQRTYIGRQNDLPLPSSFLIDAAGRLAVVYKGHVTPTQLLADRVICDAAADRILAAAIPFPGDWLRPPQAIPPRSFAIKLTEGGLLDDAKAYLNQLLPLYDAAAPDQPGADAAVRQEERAECHAFLGAIHSDQNDLPAAVHHYQTALAANPHRTATREELVRTYLALGETAEAAGQLELLLADNRSDVANLVRLASLRVTLAEPARATTLLNEALALKPDHPAANNQLANILRDAGRSPEAIRHYRAALAAQPGWPLPANNLAWILATHPEAELRDGTEALRLANLATEATAHGVPPVLGTLAAAQAECGDFPAAVATITRAIDLATAQKNPALAARLEEKRVRYRQQAPFRDSALTP